MIYLFFGQGFFLQKEAFLIFENKEGLNQWSTFKKRGLNQWSTFFKKPAEK